MKKKLILILFTCTILLLVGCSKKEQEKVSESPKPSTSGIQPVYTNLQRDAVKEEVKKIMEEENLSNVDVFMDWVSDFNQNMSYESGLVNEWTDLSSLYYKDDIIAASWQEAHKNKIDTNSRIVAFLLMQNLIEMDNKKSYGTYIMMDVAELQNNSYYSVLRDKVDHYIALFDEVQVSNAENDDDYESAYIKAWKERNIKFTDSNVSLVCVVCEDPVQKLEFVGHAGVLIDLNDTLMYIEKLSPQMPFQITKFSNRKELENELLNNRSYTIANEDVKPFILENDRLMATEE